MKVLNLRSKEIEIKKISYDLWRELHQHRYVKHFYKKDYAVFLKEFNLKPSYFNLNCLDKLQGIILTKSQIIKIELEGRKS